MVLLHNDRKKENFFKKFFLKSIDINNLSIIQKHLIFALFCLYIVTCVGIFFNWISLSDFFYNGNVYTNYCDNTGNNAEIYGNQKYRCEEQDKKVQALYPIILCSNFIMSAISGTFFDYCGPKITALIGHGFNILSWILIGLQRKGNNSIIFGSIFLGLSCDSTFIPILSLIYLFPKNHTVYTVVLGCCASLSFAIPMFLELFSKDNDINSFQLICFLYCLMILVPFLFILLIFLPLKHVSVPPEEKTERSNNTLQELESYIISDSIKKTVSNTSVLSIKGNENTSPSGKYYQEKGKKKGMIENSIIKNEADHIFLKSEKENNYLSKEKSLHVIEKGKKLPSISENKGFKEESNILNVQNVTLRKKDELEKNLYNENFVENDTEKRKNSFNIDVSNIGNKPKEKYSTLKNLWNEIKIIFFSLKYISICYYFTIYNLSLVNYNQCAKLFFKDYNDIQNLLKLFGPLSVFPCAILGFLIQKVHILPIIFFLLANNLFMNVFAILKSKIFAYFSSFCYLIVTGCYTTHLYCYIQIMFPKPHFGKIAGTTSMISGLLSLLNIPIYNYYVVDYSNNNPDNFAYIVIGLLISTFPLLFCIYIRNRIKA